MTKTYVHHGGRSQCGTPTTTGTPSFDKNLLATVIQDLFFRPSEDNVSRRSPSLASTASSKQSKCCRDDDEGVELDEFETLRRDYQLERV